MGRNISTIYCKFFILLTIFFTLSIHSQTADVDGQWSAPIGFEIVPVAVANLPDGRLLTWSASSPTTFVEVSTGATFTEIFDPSLGLAGQATGQFVSNLNHDMFCPGINLLPDGRIMAAGGATSDRTSIFDPDTGQWTPADRMNIPRGYQGNVTLSDGSIFTLGGSWADGNSPSTNGQKDAEQWSPLTGWFTLPGILGADIFTANDLATEARGLYRVDNHLWLWAAPNGKVFHAGPSEQMNWIDVANGGTITSAGLRGTDTYSMKGNTVMFDTGKLLKVGGAESYDSDHPAKDNAFVIDINDENNVTVTPTSNSLEFSRTMLNSVVLPNGEVLVTGGLNQAKVFTDVGARFQAELYNPTSNTWRTVAGMQEARTYHSVSILLSDGRVFVGGGGLCDSTPGCENHQSAEIYSPPYLFTSGGGFATRPEISLAPDQADYGDVIAVTTNSPVTEFSLIRFSGATHSTNNEQRRIPLATSTGTTHNLSIPGRNLLPPGYYMLFALDANGVPSISKSIQIGNALPLSVSPNMVLGLDFEEGTGTLAADSSGNGNDATIVERDDNGNPITPTQSYWGPGLFGNHALEMDGLEFFSNSMLEVPYSASMGSIAEEITVMAWVYRDEIEKNNGIFSHDYPEIFFGFHNSLYKWEFRSTSTEDPHCYAGYSPANKWVHIAATFNGETAKLFANGVEVCSKPISGLLKINAVVQDFSSFTSSGFYDNRPLPAGPAGTGNLSGITDEIDGRIDELKVFNKAFGEEEIKMFFDLGVQTGNPDVPVCPENTIVAEYKVGATGTWTQGNFVVANEGDEVFIRAQTTGEYFITTHQFDGPTFSSTTTPEYQIDTNVNIIPVLPPYDNPDRNNGLVDQSNNGQFVLTTAGGCPTVITLKVLGVCDPEDTPIIPEYNINGIWDSGLNVINLETEDLVILSALPNDVDGNPLEVSITLPNGSVVNDNYNLGSVTKQQHEGTYLFITSEGCSTTLELIIDDPADGCVNYISNENTMFPLPRGTVVAGLDGVFGVSADTNGSPCALELIQNDTNELFARYRISIDYAQNGLEAGDELFISIDGKGITGIPRLEVVVDDTPNSSLLSHSFGTSWETHSGTITLPVANTIDLWLFANYNTPTAGTSLYDNLIVEKVAASGPTAVINASTLSGTAPLTVDFTGSNSTDDVGVTSYLWDFGDGETATDADPSHTFTMAGTYTVSLTVSDIDDNTNTATVEINVSAVDCNSLGLETVYELNNSGNLISGESEVTVEAGNTISLSILPNDTAFSISSNSVANNSKVLNTTDLTLANLDSDDAGLYTFTTSDGCEVTLQLNVSDAPVECATLNLVPEYYLNNGSIQLASNGETIAVEYGDSIQLSAIPFVNNGTDVPVTVTLPDGSTVADDHIINSLTLNDNGVYIFTSDDNCIATLILDVNVCNVLSIAPEVAVNGGNFETFAANGTLTLEVGDAVSFSVSPNIFEGVDITLSSLSLPDGSMLTDNFAISDLAVGDTGNYIFTTNAGCTTSLNLVVNEAQGCTNTNVTPEFLINDQTTQSGNAVTLTEGNKVVLGIVQDEEFTIILPNGIEVANNYTIENIQMSEAGTYQFITSQGCTAELVITLRADLGDTSLKDLVIYPNPVKDGMLYFPLESFMNQEIKVQLTDIYGKTVYRKIFPANHQTEEFADISILSEGVYIVIISRNIGNEVTFKKIIKSSSN